MLWNVAVDSLNCQNYTSAIVLFEECSLLAENSCFKESAQVCQFVTGVCLLKEQDKNTQFLITLENLYKQLENSLNELFIQYKLQFLLATGKLNEFSRILQSQNLKLSYTQLLDLMENCKSLQVMAYLLDSCIDEEENQQIIEHICVIVQECISESISSTP
jgi:hypothetical protein